MLTKPISNSSLRHAKAHSQTVLPSFIFAQTSIKDLNIHNILSNDTAIVWKYPFDGDTLYRLRPRVNFEKLTDFEDGIYIIFLDKSFERKVFEATLINNQKEGKYKLWRSDGTKYSESDMKQNRIHGDHLTWYPDGHLKLRNQYVNGMIQKEEEWLEWDRNLVEQTIYKDGYPIKSRLHDQFGGLLEETFYRTERERTREYITLGFDSLGLIEWATKFHIDTMEIEREGEIWQVIQEVNINLDSLYAK